MFEEKIAKINGASQAAPTKKSYSVVYIYTDELGEKKQKWETFNTNAEAKKRKLQVEYEQETGSFIVPTAKTISDLLEEYMAIYGVNTWV